VLIIHRKGKSIETAKRISTQNTINEDIFFMISLSPGQFDYKQASLARLAFNPDLSTMRLHGELAEIQADAGTGLIIAAPKTRSDITVSNLSTSNSLSGDGTLPSGQTRVTLTNSSLTPSSQIYIAVVSGPKNSNLQLLSRSGDTFTVGLDSPAAQDITFKWWIIK